MNLRAALELTPGEEQRAATFESSVAGPFLGLGFGYIGSSSRCPRGDAP